MLLICCMFLPWREFLSIVFSVSTVTLYGYGKCADFVFWMLTQIDCLQDTTKDKSHCWFSLQGPAGDFVPDNLRWCEWVIFLVWCWHQGMLITRTNGETFHTLFFHTSLWRRSAWSSWNAWGFLSETVWIWAFLCSKFQWLRLLGTVSLDFLLQIQVRLCFRDCLESSNLEAFV